MNPSVFFHFLFIFLTATFLKMFEVEYLLHPHKTWSNTLKLRSHQALSISSTDHEAFSPLLGPPGEFGSRTGIENHSRSNGQSARVPLDNSHEAGGRQHLVRRNAGEQSHGSDRSSLSGEAQIIARSQIQLWIQPAANPRWSGLKRIADLDRNLYVSVCKCKPG